MYYCHNIKLLRYYITCLLIRWSWQNLQSCNPSIKVNSNTFCVTKYTFVFWRLCSRSFNKNTGPICYGGSYTELDVGKHRTVDLIDRYEVRTTPQCWVSCTIRKKGQYCAAELTKWHHEKESTIRACIYRYVTVNVANLNWQSSCAILHTKDNSVLLN